MRRSVKISSVVLAVIVAVTIGIVLYNNVTSVSTEQLRTGGFEVENGWTGATFYSGNTSVAEVGVLVGSIDPQQGVAYMQFYIAPDSGMLDSFSVELTPQVAMQCYVESPSVPAIITRDVDGISTIVKVKDLGVAGAATLALDFYLQPYQTDSFGFEVNFTMHQIDFPQTRQVGLAQVELPITYANAT